MRMLGRDSGGLCGVEASETGGLAEVVGADVRGLVEVGDGSCDLEESVVGASTETERIDEFSHPSVTFVVEFAPFSDFGGGHGGVGAVVAEAQGLDESCVLDALPDVLRRIATSFVHGVVGEEGDVDVHIDAIEHGA